MKKRKKTQADRQITGLAGEFFVAAELLKRNIQTSVTFGNAKGIDLLAFHPHTGRSFTVQVKTLRKPEGFPLKPSQVERKQIYVFVILNKPGDSVRFFIVPGHILRRDAKKFRGFEGKRKFPGIYYADLERFENKWEVFEA